MFLFIGIIMALLQGGVVRRIKLGGEKNAALWGLLLIVPRYRASLKHPLMMYKETVDVF